MSQQTTQPRVNPKVAIKPLPVPTKRQSTSLSDSIISPNSTPITNQGSKPTTPIPIFVQDGIVEIRKPDSFTLIENYMPGSVNAKKERTHGSISLPSNVNTSDDEESLRRFSDSNSFDGNNSEKHDSIEIVDGLRIDETMNTDISSREGHPKDRNSSSLLEYEISFDGMIPGGYKPRNRRNNVGVVHNSPSARQSLESDSSKENSRDLNRDSWDRLNRGFEEIPLTKETVISKLGKKKPEKKFPLLDDFVSRIQDFPKKQSRYESSDLLQDLIMISNYESRVYIFKLISIEDLMKTRASADLKEKFFKRGTKK